MTRILPTLSYEGTNAAEFVADFHGAVDDYLSLCEAENSEPEKVYKAVSVDDLPSGLIAHWHPLPSFFEYVVDSAPVHASVQKR